MSRQRPSSGVAPSSLQGKVNASLSWLLRLVARNKPPASVVPDMDAALDKCAGGHDAVAHPMTRKLLSSGKVYRLATTIIFNRQPSTSKKAASPVDEMTAVLGFLSAAGFRVVDGNGYVDARELAMASPFVETAHIALMDSLMAAYVASLVTVPAVLAAAENIETTAKSASLRPSEVQLGAAFVVWLNAISTRVSRSLGTQLDSGSVGMVRRTLPFMAELVRDLGDGRVLATLVAYYVPDVLPLRALRLENHLSVDDALYNLDLVRWTCQRLNVDFPFALEDIVYANGDLRLNLMVFLADLFVLLEMVDLDDRLELGTAAASVARRSAEVVPHQQQRQKQSQGVEPNAEADEEAKLARKNQEEGQRMLEWLSSLGETGRARGGGSAAVGVSPLISKQANVLVRQLAQRRKEIEHSAVSRRQAQERVARRVLEMVLGQKSTNKEFTTKKEFTVTESSPPVAQAAGVSSVSEPQVASSQGAGISCASQPHSPFSSTQINPRSVVSPSAASHPVTLAQVTSLVASPPVTIAQPGSPSLPSSSVASLSIAIKSTQSPLPLSSPPPSHSQTATVILSHSHTPPADTPSSPAAPLSSPLSSPTAARPRVIDIPLPASSSTSASNSGARSRAGYFVIGETVESERLSKRKQQFIEQRQREIQEERDRQRERRNLVEKQPAPVKSAPSPVKPAVRAPIPIVRSTPGRSAPVKSASLQSTPQRRPAVMSTTPRLKMQPSSSGPPLPPTRRKSNRNILRNAILHTCLSGPVNGALQKEVLARLDEARADQCLILFRDTRGFKFRALYVYKHETGALVKLCGVGPATVAPDAIVAFYKYDTGDRSFRPMQVSEINQGIDAFALEPSLWGRR